jgi:hypothetical protein
MFLKKKREFLKLVSTLTLKYKVITIEDIEFEF